MPKIILTQQERNEINFSKLLANETQAIGFTLANNFKANKVRRREIPSKMIHNTGINKSLSRIQNCINHPETMRLDELLAMAHTAGLKVNIDFEYIERG